MVCFSKAVVIAAASLLSVGVLGTAPVKAQEVTLSAKDGTIDLVGTLLSFDGTVFRIRGDMGVLAIAADEVTCEGQACPEPIVTTNWIPGQPGGDVTLTVDGGELILTGTFVSLESNVLQVQTAFGPFGLPLDRLQCEGPGCPTMEQSVTYSESSEASQSN